MDDRDIIFTTYNKDRDIEYIYNKGEPLTFGQEHIRNSNGRKRLAETPSIIRYGVENHERAYWDGLTHTGKIRERLYCSGADPLWKNMFLVVVVDYETEKKGKIITAWQAHKISDSEGDLTYVKPTK